MLESIGGRGPLPCGGLVNFASVFACSQAWLQALLHCFFSPLLLSPPFLPLALQFGGQVSDLGQKEAEMEGNVPSEYLFLVSEEKGEGRGRAHHRAVTAKSI